MKHKNIAIFIPHAGCKQECAFCNQKTIAGVNKSPTFDEVREILKKAFGEITDKADTEIAFFGGSFTAISPEMMIGYLKTANEFMGENGFNSIRISTRPDCINQEILDVLREYGVKSIELGAQSMDDNVLFYNRRGHDSDAVRKSSQLIIKNGFSLGLQMMVGLYKSTDELDLMTAKEIIKCNPQTVRIYPTVTLKGTELARLYECGEYNPISLEKAISLCSKLLMMFRNADIKVIKLGLHASDDVGRDRVAGPYHPAFKELCENLLFFNLAKDLICNFENKQAKDFFCFVAPKNLSKMIGQRQKNIENFSDMGYNIKVIPQEGLNDFDVIIKEVTVCS